MVSLTALTMLKLVKYMKVGVIVNTPAQVHFYRNLISNLRKHGNEVYLISRDYGETLPLLEELKIDHHVYAKASSSKWSKLASLPFDVLEAFKYFHKHGVEIITGFGVFDAYTSFLMGVPSVTFVDSEPFVNRSFDIQFRLFLPFVDSIITPNSFRQNLGKKHVKVNTFKEMAYVHPNYFIPNDDILSALGIKEKEDYVLLRFNAFDAVHDFNRKGFSDNDKIVLVNEISKYAKVIISTEAKLPEELKKYVIEFPKNRIHDVIYFSKLLITDTQTMATEAALLGTPVIRCNNFVGKLDMGNFIELEKKYGLIFNFNDSKKAIEKAIELVKRDKLKDDFKINHKKLLDEKIDITKFMEWIMEDYPRNLKIYREGNSAEYSMDN